MDIGPLSNRPRPIIEGRDDSLGKKGESRQQEPSSPPSDRMEISVAARAALAAATAEVYSKFGPAAGEPPTVASSAEIESPSPLNGHLSSKERIERLRERIENGFYSRNDVLDEIARRIVDQGYNQTSEGREPGQE